MSNKFVGSKGDQNRALISSLAKDGQMPMRRHCNLVRRTSTLRWQTAIRLATSHIFSILWVIMTCFFGCCLLPTRLAAFSTAAPPFFTSRKDFAADLGGGQMWSQSVSWPRFIRGNGKTHVKHPQVRSI